MKKIGITGTIASGKTTFCILLKRRGLAVFNSDRYASMCLHASHPAMKEIASVFPEVVDQNGDADKQKLADCIFCDETKRKKLNQIVHPYVIAGMEHFFASHADMPIVCAEVPLLYEAGIQDMFDEVVVVICEKETAVKRMMEDRSYSKEEAERRYDSQIDSVKQAELADIVIHNDGDLKALDHEVNMMMRRLRGRRGHDA